MSTSTTFNEKRQVSSYALKLELGVPEYYMGGPNYTKYKISAPCLFYTEDYTNKLGETVHGDIRQVSFEEAEQLFDVKVTKAQFGKPIVNSFPEKAT